VRIAVRADGKLQFVTCQLIDRAPVVTVREWRKLTSLARSSPQQQDSVEFLESALSKWKLYTRRGRIATSQRKLTQMVTDNPKIDVLAILDAKADWSELGHRVGICQLRRTWSNSIAIDFLAVHPALLAPHKQISGVGTALLYGVAQIARRIGAERIWLETTDLSVAYYVHLFGDAVSNDLLIAPAKQFYDNLHSRFEGSI
jgi:N-acetylglutamate synthase-like GNAT family acetyltransferase